MMKGHDKRKVMMKDGHILIELRSIMLNGAEINDGQEVISTDVDVQIEQIMSNNFDVETELAAITFDGEEMNHGQHMTSEHVENNNDSLNMLDARSSNINSEQVLNQKQVMLAIEDSDNAPNESVTKNCPVVKAITEERNLLTTEIINDMKADLAPIVGYAEEPLLPLSRACFPLTNILYNLSFYVQMALDETSEQPPDGLTIDESAAIRLYTIEWERPHRSLYSTLNYTLKNENREHLQPYFKYLKLFLTALVKLPCVPPLTVWRGVTKNLSEEFPPGTLVTWWAFSSCTNELTVLENKMYLGNTGSRTLFSVEAINGRIIRAHSHFVTEDEILLLPGTHMIVQSQFSPAPDLHIIHLKQVIPQKVLLEPPFEGILNIFNQLV
ncbi:unnamed protein product [Rotaria sp. Silwood2]|nr:unnamed protein product [Rotaria sp. Silwood2]CAF2710617.1 unnamed protein product [Rotaria sp. Silwood2]CAF3139969.1 unnamed protein product [Rotaria sp. Silwood2]CAF4073092.1 unnamed protein product [Rotaria sp. Silwood2]CAF4152694.1 unnamed protein product [Rotaria sp. Silwood2]